MARATCLLLLAALLVASCNAEVISGIGGSCSLRGPGPSCAREQTCADWVNGGTCCTSPFVTKEGEFCSVSNGVCCMDSLMCKNNKCVKAGPPPCRNFAQLGGDCNLLNGQCCGGNRVQCVNAKCTSSYPKPILCKEYAGYYGPCDPGRGYCCSEKRDCVKGRCSGNPPKPVCKQFAQIGGTCDPARGFCCGGNRINCMSGRCIASMGGH